MKITFTNEYQGLEVFPELDVLLDQMFAAMPNLEYVSCGSRPTGLDTKRKVCQVEVYDGEQKLGTVGYMRVYTSKGNVPMYEFYSRSRIQKSRGDKHKKRTKNLKAALTLAKQVFVKSSVQAFTTKIYEAIRSRYGSLIWQVENNYNSMCSSHSGLAFAYVVEMIDGSNAAMDPQLLQLIQSDRFKEARNNYRIAKTVKQSLEKCTGVIVYVDRKNKLTMADLEKVSLHKIESTYDLPKNYQEKYTMLKIMEFNQPIEGVGVKLSIEVEDQKYECYYLKPGDTIITH